MKKGGIFTLAVFSFLCAFSRSTWAIAGLRHEHPKQADAAETAISAQLESVGRQRLDSDHLAPFAKLVRGNPRTRTVALTFDDGPHPLLTERLLEILRQQKVKATFFVVGKMVERRPDLVKLEAADGHEVASHTYNHFRLPTLSASLIEQELRAGSTAIQRVLGTAPRFYRPPGGEYNDLVVEMTKRLGMTMVLWTADPADFAYPPPQVIEKRILEKVENGGIILLHDGIPQTMMMLPDLIHRLRAKGYKFVTCTEMAGEQGVITRGGPCIVPGKLKLDRLRGASERT